MENTLNIRTGALFTIVQPIPEGALTDTVTIEIKRISDGYTWNFTALEFQNASNSGTMTAVNADIWKQTFTPPTSDTYAVTINDTTLDVKHFQTLISSGVAPVTGAADICDYADVKAFLGIPVANTDDDVLIASETNRAIAEAERHCKRTFAVASHTEYYDGGGVSKLQLDQYPVVSITSIYDDLARSFGSDSLIDSDNIISGCRQNDIAGIVELLDLIFSDGRKNVKVVYTAGYGSSYDYPQDLTQAIIELAAAIYLEGKGGVNAMEAQEIVYRPSYLKKQAYAVLNRYMRMDL